MAHVLVVDDNEELVETWASALRQAGHEVEARFDGVSALEYVRDTGADVAVCDVMMPRLGGVAFAGEARVVRPQLKIIVVTGDSGAMDPAVDALSLARDVGADRTLNKPFSLDLLVETVESMLAPPR